MSLLSQLNSTRLTDSVNAVNADETAGGAIKGPASIAVKADSTDKSRAMPVPTPVPGMNPPRTPHPFSANPTKGNLSQAQASCKESAASVTSTWIALATPQI